MQEGSCLHDFISLLIIFVIGRAEIGLYNLCVVSAANLLPSKKSQYRDVSSPELDSNRSSTLLPRPILKIPSLEASTKRYRYISHPPPVLYRLRNTLIAHSSRDRTAAISSFYSKLRCLEGKLGIDFTKTGRRLGREKANFYYVYLVEVS
jgi:hypothetical protein